MMIRKSTNALTEYSQRLSLPRLKTVGFPPNDLDAARLTH